MTPEQTKLVLDNLGAAKRAAEHHSRGALNGHYDDLYSVALLRLCEIAIAEQGGKGDFRKHAYWQCRYAIADHVRSSRFGRIGGRTGVLPDYLGALSPKHADELVQWSLTTIPVSDGNRAVGSKIPFHCSMCGVVGMSKRTHGKKAGHIELRKQG